MSLTENPRQTKVVSLVELQPIEGFDPPVRRYKVASDTILHLHPYRGKNPEILQSCSSDEAGNKYLYQMTLKAGDEIWLQNPTAPQARTEDIQGKLEEFAYVMKYNETIGHGGPSRITDLARLKVEIEL